MKVKYIAHKTNNFTPGKIYEAVGINDKRSCYFIENTDKGRAGVFSIKKFVVIHKTTGEKCDPMYYRDKINGLIEEAQKNGLRVYAKNNLKGMYLYFEAHEYEIWGVKLPEVKEEE